MYKSIFSGVALVASVASAQTFDRRAVFTNNGGGGDRGECTVEVVVDGAAQVEIRQGTGLLRNISGQAPQWRRFECTSAIPANPVNFRFEGVDGRGTQRLISDPRNGGVATVRIDDSDNGSEGYTFRLVWGSDTRGPAQDQYRRGPGPVGSNPEDFYTNRESAFLGNNWRALFFQRVREDLDHATSDTYGFNGDRARLARTRTQLDELQQKLSRGFYDERELDDVIAAMRVVLQANRLPQRDRAILSDDLTRLEDFRVRHDQYGARADNGYRPDRDRFDDRGRAGGNDRSGGDDRRARFFQNIREDLDRATATSAPFGGDRSRLANTRAQLDELQQKLGRGYFDERQLIEVMGSFQAVIEDNRLRPAERDILREDLDRMRDFRTRHDQYGAR